MRMLKAHLVRMGCERDFESWLKSGVRIATDGEGGLVSQSFLHCEHKDYSQKCKINPNKSVCKEISP